MSDPNVLTLDTWVQFKRKYTPILICCAADEYACKVLAERMNVAQTQLRTGGVAVLVEVNDLIPAGFAFFKPPMHSREGTWPLPEHEQFKIVRLYPQPEQEGAASEAVQGDEAG